MYRILIADDEGIMLESLKNIISSNYGNECEIHTAKTGRVVVEEAEKYPPDICFMDIQMPGLSGIQAIREIQLHNMQSFAMLFRMEKELRSCISLYGMFQREMSTVANI